MAANIFDVSATSITVSTLATMVLFKPAANMCVKWIETSASFNGAVSSNAPALVQLAETTAATAGGGTATSPVKRDTGRPETVLTACTTAYTAEPGVKTVLRSIYVGQYNGVYHYINPFSSPYLISGVAAASMAGLVEVTSPNSVACNAHVTCEE